MLIKTFNGFDLQNSNYRSRMPGVNNLARASNGFVQLSNAFPQDAGVFQIEPRTIALDVRIKNYATRDALEQALAAALFPGTAGNLVATFGTTDYQLYCRVESISQSDTDPTAFTVIFNCGESVWVSTAAVAASTWTVTTTTSTWTRSITVGGELETLLSLGITPTGAAASGYRYKQLYELVPPVGFEYGRWPWCIVMDTAAQVGAGRMRSDCYDLRIFWGDVEVRRFIANPNNASTKIWMVPTFPEGLVLTLGANIASSGAVGEIQFRNTTSGKERMKKLPSSGLLVHGNEWFAYSGKNNSTCRVSVTARGALGTTLQAHTAGDQFNFFPRDVTVVYGDASAVNPSTLDDNYDDDKPIFDLAQSDNEHWVYTATTGFIDTARPNRPGTWAARVKAKGDVSEIYLITGNGDSGNPAMGMLMGCYQLGGKWKEETATLSWRMRGPGGVQKVTMTGAKKRTTARFPKTAALQYSADAVKWKTAWNELSPVALDTATAINQADKSTGNLEYVQFALDGSMAALASALAYFEVLTAIVYFPSANLPTGRLMGHSTGYNLALQVKNQANGDQIGIRFPMRQSDTFEIDGELREAKCEGVNAHGAISLNDESRAAWIRLKKGANVIEVIPDATVGTLEIVLSYYTRRA